MENINIEYKSKIPKKPNHLKAEIVSFLNTEGEVIYLGVDDNGLILEDKKTKSEPLTTDTLRMLESRGS